MNYQEAVRRGREAAKSQWVLGDLAREVETSYGEGKLQQFADDIGVDPGTLWRYRQVAGAFPEKSLRSENLPWSVFKEFASQEDREQLIQRKKWTVSSAREFLEDRAVAKEGKAKVRKEAKAKQKETEAATKEERAKEDPKSAEDQLFLEFVEAVSSATADLERAALLREQIKLQGRNVEFLPEFLEKIDVALKKVRAKDQAKLRLVKEA